MASKNHFLQQIQLFGIVLAFKMEKVQFDEIGVSRYGRGTRE
jgi:hypothetical protein